MPVPGSLPGGRDYPARSGTALATLSWQLLAVLGLRTGEYPSTGVFQRYPRDRRTAYGSKGGSCPGARLQVDLSRGFLGAGRSRLNPGNVLWDEVGSSSLVCPVYNRVAALNPSHHLPLGDWFLSSSKEKEGGGVTVTGS